MIQVCIVTIVIEHDILELYVFSFMDILLVLKEGRKDHHMGEGEIIMIKDSFIQLIMLSVMIKKSLTLIEKKVQATILIVKAAMEE